VRSRKLCILVAHLVAKKRTKTSNRQGLSVCRPISSFYKIQNKIRLSYAGDRHAKKLVQETCICFSYKNIKQNVFYFVQETCTTVQETRTRNFLLQVAASRYDRHASSLYKLFVRVSQALANLPTTVGTNSTRRLPSCWFITLAATCIPRGSTTHFNPTLG